MHNDEFTPLWLQERLARPKRKRDKNKGRAGSAGEQRQNRRAKKPKNKGFAIQRPDEIEIEISGGTYLGSGDAPSEKSFSGKGAQGDNVEIRGQTFGFDSFSESAHVRVVPEIGYPRMPTPEHKQAIQPEVKIVAMGGIRRSDSPRNLSKLSDEIEIL